MRNPSSHNLLRSLRSFGFVALGLACGVFTFLLSRDAISSAASSAPKRSAPWAVATANSNPSIKTNSDIVYVNSVAPKSDPSHDESLDTLYAEMTSKEDFASSQDCETLAKRNQCQALSSIVTAWQQTVQYRKDLHQTAPEYDVDHVERLKQAEAHHGECARLAELRCGLL